MATTKENVRAKVIELLDHIRPHLEERLDKLLDSSAINYDEEEDHWGLPKDIVQALSKEMEFQYKNINATRKDMKRIARFTAIIRFPDYYR